MACVIDIQEKGRALLFVLTCFLSFVLHAQPANSHLSALTSHPSLSPDTAFNLNELVVTGTRAPRLLKDVPVQTKVITHQDIQNTDATNIQDLLQQVMPGVEFSYAMNQQVHLNMCGFGGQNVLFLVDGERMAGETMDDVDFTRLVMAGVHHIEIVRGAASALYGSNAGGGVVNIITHEETGKPWSLNVNARLARHNERRFGAHFACNSKYVSNTLYADHCASDNYDVSNDPYPPTRVFSTVYGNKNCNVRDRLVVRPTDNLKLVARAGYFFRTLSRTPDTPERYRDFSGGLKATWQISSNDLLDAAYNFDQYDKSDYYRLKHLDIRDYSNVQNSFRMLYSHDFSKEATLTVGADVMHDYLFNQNLEGNTREQDIADAFAQMDWNVGQQWELVGALRYDYYSDGHQSHLTPKLTACYRPLRNLTLRCGYGMGFRAPTLKEKYYNFDMAGIWIVQGNQDLHSEVSHNFNVSAEWTKGNYDITLATYYNHIDHKLATGLPFYKNGDTKQLYLDYINLDNYAVYGAEATAQARWNGGFAARLSYAFTREQLPGDGNGRTVSNQYIPARRHALTANFEWNHQFSRNYSLGMALSGRVLSAIDNTEYIDYYDIQKGTRNIHYPAYTIWKLSTQHRIGKALRFTLALDNLFNYRPSYYFLNAPITDGINLQAGFSLDLD